ncbi:hypothetical protein [Nannocystis sp.]|uniref:hypothetical protein n=1 Tax=Nannocystis sp. TaxID=1962667 RepID=UPI0025E1C69E|nr:hypothetical protein [Nannocystis sp.]MBK7829219.1 hypothetical protein [Nannocystis sp.]
MLLIEILLSENKAREALSKFRSVKARTPRVLAAMQRIADGVAARRPRDAARLYAEIADHHGMADEHRSPSNSSFAAGCSPPQATRSWRPGISRIFVGVMRAAMS